MWTEAFNLPPSDERLSSLTAREAIEQVLLLRSVQEIKAEQIAAAKKQWQQQGDDQVIAEEVVGAKAEKIADEPKLTGDAEWDAVELAETDPMREPFDEGRFR
jgi:hypothetical protein